MTREEIAAVDRECEEQHISQRDQESFLTVEIRTSCGSAMRIQGNMTAAHLREIISASNV